MENTMRIREHIGYLMRTHWELKGTCWKRRKNENCYTPPPQNLEEKKLAA